MHTAYIDTPIRHTPSTRRTPTGLKWAAGALLVVVVSAAALRIAGTRPSFDPYGWLLWGKMTVHGHLDLDGAPSWKPLPYLFTLPYALAGHNSVWLWMTTALAVSLSGAVWAARLAFRVGGGQQHRAAGWVAGGLAAAALLCIRGYGQNALNAEADPMVAALCLAAIDCWLSDRPRWALWLWAAAALGRPEAWAFFGLYAIWAWRAQPRLRPMVAAAVLLVPALWFAIPAASSYSWFQAGENALNSPNALHSGRVLGTVGRLLTLQDAVVWVAALGATALAVLRRERTGLVLAAGVVLWLALEIVFVLHGWSGVSRYMFPAAAMACALAGGAAARVIVRLPRSLADPRLRFGLAGLLVCAAVASLVRPARARIQAERRDLAYERRRSADLKRLDIVVRRLGPERMLACAQINIPLGWQSALAWYMDVNTARVYVFPAMRRNPPPLLNMYPITRGWKVFLSHADADAARRCRGMQVILRTPW